MENTTNLSTVSNLPKCKIDGKALIEEIEKQINEINKSTRTKKELVLKIPNDVYEALKSYYTTDCDLHEYTLGNFYKGYEIILDNDVPPGHIEFDVK